MIILAYIVLTFTGIQLIVALVNLLSETIIPPASGVSMKLVSVLIPARNEEKNIGLLLDDLLSQDYGNLEIIVFNDQSDDSTDKIVTEYTISDMRVRLINSPGLPQGWLGKNCACHSMATEATGSFFLFLDADVRISGNMIERAVGFSEKNDLSLVSVFPEQEIVTMGEWITVPNMNFILLSLLPLILVRKTRFPSLAAANGQFMFFEAENYRELNPHEIMKNNRVEDISIARLYKKTGHRVACMLGDDDLTCRMYTRFMDAVSGFSKNVTAFFGNSFILATLFWIITTFGFIPVLLSTPPIVFTAFLAAYIATRIIISAASRQKIIYNLVFIIPLQISLAFFIYTALKNRIYGKYKWKGRNID